jgi:hypothetical protein
MPFLLLLLLGAGAIALVARSQSPTNPQLGTGGSGAGAGAGAGAAAPNEMTAADKLDFAKALVGRTLAHEADSTTVNKMDLLPTGQMGDADAVATLYNINVVGGHPILIDSTAAGFVVHVLVPMVEGGENALAAKGQPYAIFLRPREASTLFVQAGIQAAPPPPDTKQIGSGAGEVKMLGMGPSVAASLLNPMPTKPGSLDLTGAATGTPLLSMHALPPAMIDASNLPDGDPVQSTTGGDTGTDYGTGAHAQAQSYTVYPLKNIREAYLAFKAGDASKTGSYWRAATNLLTSDGYTLAASETNAIASSLGA